jgi:16S rRNA (guanine966-N2)-methyltransferase
MKPIRTELRVGGGELRRRKLLCVVNDDLRPTPDRVRQSYFNIIGPGIAGRPFFDVFAGTGIHGIEAISRGAVSAVLLERDPKLATIIEGYLREFGIDDKASVQKVDVYRWAERWIPPLNPPLVFFSPPFRDLTERFAEFRAMVESVCTKSPVGSVICVQGEEGFPLEAFEGWDIRQYGRNILCFWSHLAPETPAS